MRGWWRENRVGSRCSGKERDSETGLDNFGKRYYGSALGRFITPDPLLNSGQPWNPQSWNRYAYVENNPLRYTDPTGLYKFGDCSGSADKCKAEQQRFRDSITNAKESLKNLDPKSKEAKALRSTLNKLGEEGKGDVKINFGDAGETDGRPNLGKTVGHNITINYDAVDGDAKDADLNASEKAALDAGVTTHEGTHTLGNGLKGWFQGHFEHPAYYTESVTYQGLHNTDKAFGLMKLILSCACVSILILSCCAFGRVQESNQPIDTTLCELYQHPDHYAGKMIRVRGTIAGNDMWIDAFTEKPCPASMSIVVVFPSQVKPAPGFDLVKDESFNKFEEAMYHSRPIHIEAMFEGRFDSAVTIENGKRVEGKGYGKKHQHNGRIVLHRVSDVTARPLGRK